LRVYLVRMGPENTVRTALQLDELDAFDLLRQPTASDLDRQNAVRITVHDERRHVDAPDVLAEILDPGIDAIERTPGRSGRGHIPVPRR